MSPQNSRPDRHALSRFGWTLIPCRTPGIEALITAVDEVYVDLVNDLQRTEFAMTYRGRNTAVPLWARARRLAVRLAQAAMQRREESGDRLTALREELHGLSGLDFAQRIGRNAETLQRLLRWVPAERWHHAERGSFTGGGRLLPHRTVEHMELPHIAYLAVTTRALDDVLAETVTFIDLALEAEALDAEHLARWQRRLTPGVAALVLFGDGPWPAADEERAFHVLSSYLPTADIRSGAYGGAQVDRLEDFPQQAQFRLVEELRRLEKTLTPLERLGLLYEADPRLTHIANAALDRFRHDREKERRRAGKARFTLLADVAAKKRRDHNQKTDIADTRGDEEVVISGVAMPEVLVPPEAIEAWILRRFRHTKAQRQILRALVYRDDLDPRDPGFVGAWAEVSGYARETVSRYRSKLADTIQDARTFLE